MSRRVFQTKFGGPDVPPEAQGDCMQAALATMLGIPLSEAFDFREAAAEQKRPTGWWFSFIDWCHERGWHPLILSHPLPGVIGMAGVQSHRLFADDGHPLGHQVVVRGAEVVHDPGAPFGEESYEIDRGESDADSPEYWYLVPCDPVPDDPLPSLPGHPRIRTAISHDDHGGRPMTTAQTGRRERGVNRSCRQMGQQHQFQLAQAEPKFGSTSEVVYVVVCSRCGEVRRQEAAQ